MRWIRSFLAFWYDFIVGDDWTVAVGVVAALALTAALAHLAHLPAWWLLPLAAVALLAFSLRRAIRQTRQT
jgi:thiamine transporter ThiT